MPDMEGAVLRQYLYDYYGPTFQVLAKVSGYASNMLDEPALHDQASPGERWADQQRQTEMSNIFFKALLGPYAVQESVEYAEYADAGPVRTTTTASTDDMAAQKVFDCLPAGESSDSDLLNRDAIYGLTNTTDAVKEYAKAKHAPFREIASGRLSHYYHVYGRTPIRPNSSSPAFEIRVPIGEYGAGFSLGLQEATYHTIGNPTKAQLQSIHNFAIPHFAMLEKHVTWVINETKYSLEGPYLGFALSKSVYEGDVSIQQGISMLTAERVKGFETGLDLWQAIRRAKLLERFARLLPFGNLAPATLINSYIPELVIPDGKREVTLNPDVESELRAYKQTILAAIAEDVQMGLPISRNEMGIFCPALNTGGGFERRHDLLFRRYVQLARSEAAG